MSCGHNVDEGDGCQLCGMIAEYIACHCSGDETGSEHTEECPKLCANGHDWDGMAASDQPLTCNRCNARTA
jgi:hypothetical protein